MAENKLKCTFCGYDKEDGIDHVVGDEYRCHECKTDFFYRPLDNKTISKPTERKSFSELIGFYHGWVAARQPAQDLVDVIDAIIEYAEEYRHGRDNFSGIAADEMVANLELNSIKAENVRLNRRCEYLSSLREKKEPFRTCEGIAENEEKTWLPEDTDRYVPEALQEIRKPSEKGNYKPYEHSSGGIAKEMELKTKVLRALRTKTIYAELYPLIIKSKPFCYRCKHLGDGAKPRDYPLCGKYNVNIRAWQSERDCEGFELSLSPLKRLPLFRCMSCYRYDKEGHSHKHPRTCDALKITIKNASENKFGMCPYWKSTFKEPVKLSKEMIKKGKLNKEENKG